LPWQAHIRLRVLDPHARITRQIVEALAAERQRLGWSFERLAVEADVSNSCIRHLERARSTPTLITLLKLAAALQMDLPDLLREAQKIAEPKKPKPRR
jgi:ribosome-binding protein aMBF1 (putative translation factor)